MSSETKSPVKLTFLGTGTSHGIPVMTCYCEVCASEQAEDKRLRSSVMVEKGNTRIVIDVGPDFRTQMLREKVNEVDAVLITHEHRDHIAGVDDIRAYNYRTQSPLDFYCVPRVEKEIRQAFAYVFEGHQYPGLPSIAFQNFDDEAFTVGELEILPIPVMHYQLPVSGFRMGSIAYITDVNFISEESLNKLKGLKYLVLGCLRKTPHIAHYQLEEALDVARVIGAEQTYFIHMSHDMGLHHAVEAELPAHVHLSYDGLVLQA